MSGFIKKLFGIVMLSLVGVCVSQATQTEGSISARGIHAQPSAPRVMCTVKMNFWCIVQADAGLSMINAGDYRIWKMTAPGSESEVVTIRESRSCDSPAAMKPRKKSVKDDRRASGEHWHSVELSISDDGACTLQVAYLAAGDAGLSLDARQIAKNRLYLCDGESCERPLLDVK